MRDEEFQTLLGRISFSGVVTPDEIFRGGDHSDRSTSGDTVPDPTTGSPGTFEDRARKEALVQAVDDVNPRERMVLALYYDEGLTFSEIGDILGVTESRVVQIHAKAVLVLKSKFADRLESLGQGLGGDA
jgi:RNA polymerase sigma factor for flagellar operon FliA